MAIKEFEVGKYYLLKNPGFHVPEMMSLMAGTVRKCLRVEDGVGGFEPNAETPVDMRVGDQGLFWWPPSAVDHAPLEVGKYYRLQAWQERIERPSGTHFGPWNLQSSGVREICGNVMLCLRVDYDGDGCFAGGWCWPYEHVFLVEESNTNVTNEGPQGTPTITLPTPVVEPLTYTFETAADAATVAAFNDKPNPEMVMLAETIEMAAEKPTLPFSPTYRRFCWHKWVYGPSVAKEIAWLPVSVGLLGMVGLLAVCISNCLPPIPYCMVSMAVPLLFAASCYFSTKTVADKICTKCGRSKLDFQLMLSRRTTAERKRQAKHQAKAEKAAAEKELNEAALAKLNTYIELARKARD